MLTAEAEAARLAAEKASEEAAHEALRLQEAEAVEFEQNSEGEVVAEKLAAEEEARLAAEKAAAAHEAVRLQEAETVEVEQNSDEVEAENKTLVLTSAPAAASSACKQEAYKLVQSNQNGPWSPQTKRRLSELYFQHQNKDAPTHYVAKTVILQDWLSQNV